MLVSILIGAQLLETFLRVVSWADYMHFSIYVNDMPLQVSSSCLLQFTDDTALICCGNSFGGGGFMYE